MANFNLADYETVEERIKRFFEIHPDGRIITDNVSTDLDRASKIWVVKASIYVSAEEQANCTKKSTGYAFEIDGTAGANRTSALENAETSAIGRALANMNLSGNKRSSRVEMEKVQRGETVQAIDWNSLVAALSDKNQARTLYAKAQKSKAGETVLAAIEKRAGELPNAE